MKSPTVACLRELPIIKGDIIQITHYTGEETFGACIGKDTVKWIEDRTADDFDDNDTANSPCIKQAFVRASGCE